MQAASALLAFLDPEADPEKRLDGALLVASFIADIRTIRRFLTDG